MVFDSQVVATAAASFLLGWAFSKRHILNLFKLRRNLQRVPQELRLVIVVRGDLGMKKGLIGKSSFPTNALNDLWLEMFSFRKIAAQSCHAALACYRQGMIVCPNLIKQWESQGETKVVLRTDSGEASLREISKKAANMGLVAALVRDAGRTQVPSGSVTAVGIGPGYSAEIAQVTSGLKLM